MKHAILHDLVRMHHDDDSYDDSNHIDELFMNNQYDIETINDVMKDSQENIMHRDNVFSITHHRLERLDALQLINTSYQEIHPNGHRIRAHLARLMLADIIEYYRLVGFECEFRMGDYNEGYHLLISIPADYYKTHYPH